MVINRFLWGCLLVRVSWVWGAVDTPALLGLLKLRCIRSLPNAKDIVSPFCLPKKYASGGLFAIGVIAPNTDLHKATCYWMISPRVLPPAFHSSRPQHDLWQCVILNEHCTVDVPAIASYRRRRCH